MLILDTVGHVDHSESCRNFAKLRFQDVGRGGRSKWSQPLAPMEKQGCLFLCSGNRDSEFMLHVYAKWRLGQIGEHLLNLSIADGLSIDRLDAVKRDIIRQELHGTHTIPPNALQQAVGVAALSAGSFGNAATHRRIVGQQIVEDGDHQISGVRRFAQGQ